MRNLESLFIEFNCTNIESLEEAVNNQIDWYTEKLYDFPWDTWAQTKLDSLKELSKEIDILFVQFGADNDIDR